MEFNARCQPARSWLAINILTLNRVLKANKIGWGCTVNNWQLVYKINSLSITHTLSLSLTHTNNKSIIRTIRLHPYDTLRFVSLSLSHTCHTHCLNFQSYKRMYLCAPNISPFLHTFVCFLFAHISSFACLFRTTSQRAAQNLTPHTVQCFGNTGSQTHTRTHTHTHTHTTTR